MFNQNVDHGGGGENAFQFKSLGKFKISNTDMRMTRQKLNQKKIKNNKP
jgi:hypothetical protein